MIYIINNKSANLLEIMTKLKKRNYFNLKNKYVNNNFQINSIFFVMKFMYSNVNLTI